MATKRAMIVGINEYGDGINNLVGAENDAKEICDILTTYGDFEVDKDKHFLLGPEATGDAIRSAISDLLWMTDPRDVTLFYFSGHGFKDSYGTVYLAPVDMDPQRPLVHGVEMQRLQRLALESPKKDAIVLIFDCCYAGTAAAESKGKGAGTKADTTDVYSDMFEVASAEVPPSGYFVFASSAKTEKSREIKRPHKLGDKKDAHPHGAMTFHLLEGLAGEAPTKNGDEISVADLFSYVQDSMKTEPGQTFKGKRSDETNPQRIILARASTLKKLREELPAFEGYLKSNSISKLILGAIEFGRVSEGRSNHPEVKNLSRRFEDELVDCKTQSIRWFVPKKAQLMQQANGQRLKQLNDLVFGLCLERICKEPEEMRGLLLTLVESAEQKSGPNDLAASLKALEGSSPEADLRTKKKVTP